MADVSGINEYVRSAAGLSLLGGIASGGMTNMFNQIQNEDQRDWSEKMWRLNNEYNTPANQMKRLRAAGVNPHFAISGGQLSSGTSSSQADLTSPHPYDFSPVAEGISKSAELYQQQRFQDADIGLKNQQAENMRIRNDYEDRRQWLELLKLENDSSLSSEQKDKVRSERELLEKDLETRGERNRAEIQRVYAERERAIYDARKARLEGDWQNIVNQYEIPNRVKVLRNLDAQYDQILSAAASNNAAAANQAAQAALHGVEKSTAEKIQKHVVDKAFYEVKESKFRGEEVKWRAGNEYKYYRYGRIKELPVGGNDYPKSGSPVNK